MSVPSLLGAQEMIVKFFVLFLFLSLTQKGIVNAVSVVEVPAGDLAELPCLSSDDNHRFMFWQLIDERHIVGPGNEIDEKKYNYEVLTGKLYIKGVSTKEEGFYRCISKGIEDLSSIKVHVVELIVKKDPLVENTFETNLLRGMAVAMVIVVGIAVTLLVLLIKRKRTQNIFDVMNESRENSPAKYLGNVRSAPATPSTSRTLDSGGFDNMGMNVDFESHFKQTQKGQPILPL